MKAGILGVTCHTDGEEKGRLKLLGDGNGEAIQMLWSFELRMADMLF